MSAKDIKNSLNAVHHLDAKVVTVTADGTPAAGIDMTSYNALMFAVNVGANANFAAGVYLELEIQHSVDDAAWVAATNDEISDPVTGTNTGTFALINATTEDQTTFTCGVKDPTAYKFWRLFPRVTGTLTGGVPLGVVALQGHPDNLPAV